MPIKEPAKEPEPEGWRTESEEDGSINEDTSAWAESPYVQSAGEDEDASPSRGKFATVAEADSESPFVDDDVLLNSASVDAAVDVQEVDHAVDCESSAWGWGALRRRRQAGLTEPAACVSAESVDTDVDQWKPAEDAGAESAETADEIVQLGDTSTELVVASVGADCFDGAAPGDAVDADPDSWLVVERGGLVVEEKEAAALTSSTVEAKVEQVLAWMLTPAVRGIPALGVPSAMDRADELLATNGRDLDAAARDVIAGSEKTVSSVVSNFCLERIPIFGCPTVILRTTWANLRSVLIIAALYGHDLEAPRVQHEALLCLVPPGSDDEVGVTIWRGEGKDSVQQAQMLTDTTQKVAKLMIKGALKRVTGLQAAVDCFELASLLYNSCGQDTADEDEDGFVHVSKTPASAAHDLFRKQSLASCALLWCSLPMLMLGLLAPQLFFIIRWIPAVVRLLHSIYVWLPKPLSLRSFPPFILAVGAIFFSVRTCLRFLGLNYRRGFSRLFWRLLPRRVRDAWRDSHVAQALHDVWPQLVTTSVFGLHAVLPAISTYSAVSIIINSIADSGVHGETDPNGWDVLHRISGVALGLYSFCAVVSRHIHNEHMEPEEANASQQVYVLMALRVLGIMEAASRALSVLMVWVYACLMLDLWCTQIAYLIGRWSPEATSTLLGVMPPVAWVAGAVSGTNPLHSEKAMHITLQLVSIVSQQRLVRLLSRREVVLKMIGAERLTAQTLMLLLKGVAVACSSATSSNPIAEFLEAVAPPPMCVAFIVALRGQAVAMGAIVVTAPWLLYTNVLGNALTLLFGHLAGAYVSYAFLSVWYENRTDLESPALRLALLVPGAVSGRAKILLRGALLGARARAVQMVAVSLVQRIMRWWLRPIAK